jgi:hypothetical protein
MKRRVCAMHFRTECSARTLIQPPPRFLCVQIERAHGLVDYGMIISHPSPHPRSGSNTSLHRNEPREQARGRACIALMMHAGGKVAGTCRDRGALGLSRADGVAALARANARYRPAGGLPLVAPGARSHSVGGRQQHQAAAQLEWPERRSARSAANVAGGTSQKNAYIPFHVRASNPEQRPPPLRLR